MTSYWTIPVRNHEEGESYFDNQHNQLKTERDGIDHKLNNLSEGNRKLRPKENVHRIQTDYEDLFKAYGLLQRELRAVTAKHKSSLQLIGKLKKEIQTLKLRCAVPRQSNSSNFARRHPTLDRKMAVKESDNTECPSENNALIGQLQSRLASAETELQILRRDSKSGEAKTEVRLTTVVVHIPCLLRHQN